MKLVRAPVSVFPVFSARMFKNTTSLIFPLILMWYNLYIHMYPHAHTYAHMEPHLMAKKEEAPRAL